MNNGEYLTMKEFPKTKHWLFDFDGTLVDSMPFWSACMTGVLDRHSVPYGEDIINIITPLGTIGTIKYFQEIGLSLSIEEIKEEISSDLTSKYRDIIPEKKGVRDCLVAMKNNGYKLHVLTASPHAWLDPCLKRLNMYDLFDNVWSSDDFGTGKTDPNIYHRVAEKIGADVSDITFLDDNINADKTAKSAGTKVIAVYDETSKNDEEEMKSLFDGYVYDFEELKGAVCTA